MLYIKDGFPKDNELVKCKVSKIIGNVVFVNLEEYDKDGILNISEIAAGRIRTIKDYVEVGKIIICRVIRVNEYQKRIDVSLRRVGSQSKIRKLEELKKEEFCKTIYNEVSKKLNIKIDDLLEKTLQDIFDNYESVFDFFYTILQDEKEINTLNSLKDNEKKVFLEIILDKIKPEKFLIKEKFKLYCNLEDGIIKIKKTLKEVLSFFKDKNIKILYLAAGNYSIEIESESKKISSKILDDFKKKLILLSKNNNLITDIKE